MIWGGVISERHNFCAAAQLRIVGAGRLQTPVIPAKITKLHRLAPSVTYFDLPVFMKNLTP
jgi:hypothetical protein